MINIQFTRQGKPPLDEGQIQQVVLETLRQAGSALEVDLAVVLTSDPELQRLNREYLGIDAPTDVLSFPAGFTDPDTHRPYLGDILISLERLREQAETNQQTIQQELKLLVVHGVLHLLGYDHANEDEKERMWAVQESTLSQLAGGAYTG